MSDIVKIAKRHTIGVAAIIATLCLAGNTWWLFSNIVHVIQANDWVERQAMIQYDLSRIEAALLNAETGQRGYVLTGNTDYLAPYHTGQAMASGLLSDLETILEDNPGQMALLSELDVQVQNKFDELGRTIALMVLQGQGSAREQIATGLGRQIMDDIRAVIRQMNVLNEAELVARQMAQSGTRVAAFVALGVFVGGVLILIATLLWVSRRELLRQGRDAAEIENYAHSLNHSLAELKEERNEIRALHETAGFLQSCDSVSELASVLGPILERMFSGFKGQVLVHSASRNRLDCVISFGEGSSSHPIVPADCWGLRRGQDHVHRAGQSSPVCLHFAQQGQCDMGADTFCIPLIAHGETIGLLSMARHNTMPNGVVADDSLEAAWGRAERLCTQLGLTLANLKLRESLRQQAIRDALTNAFNRRYLEAISDKILAQSARFDQTLAVVMLDVDHFKQFNDLHGHQAGDHALIAVAQHIQLHIREADWLFRYGGEEFLIILQGLDPEDARAKLDEIREGVSKVQFSNGETVLPGVTISLGCAFRDQHTTASMAELIAAADDALYRAKHNGRNQVCVAATPVLIEAVA